MAQGTTLAAGGTSLAHWASDFSIVQQQGLEREYGHFNGHYNSQRCWAFPSLILNFQQLRQSDLVYGASWIFANENICCTPPHIPDNLNGSQWIWMVYDGLCWSCLNMRWIKFQTHKFVSPMVSTRLAQNGPSVPHTLQLPLLQTPHLAWPTVSKHPASQIKAIWLSANKNCAFLCPTDRTTFSPHVCAHCVDKGAIVFLRFCQVSCMHWTTSRCM